MKPLVLVFVATALMSSALAQTARRPKRQGARKAAPTAKPRVLRTAPVSTAPATAAPAPAAPPQFLQIRYFGEYAGSNLYRWDDTLVDVDGKRNYSDSIGSDPLQWFHQFSFRFLVADNIRLFVEPRFVTQFGGRNEMGAEEDQQFIQQLDHRFGLMSNYWASADGVWSTTYRLGTRLPTSRGDKNAQHILQPEALHITNLTISPQLSFGLWNQIRYYWYEQNVDAERWRLYTGPSMTYTIDDIWSVFVMYEHEYQHRSRGGNTGNGRRRRNFFNGEEILQDVYAGVNYNINPSLTFYPFIRFAQVSKWDTQTMQAGFWLMGAIY